jgi:gas vesicle protein
MSDHSHYSGAHLLIAFLAGAAAGAAVALLTAPAPGREARESVRGWAKDAQGRVERVPRAVRSAYTEAARAAKDAFVRTFEAESTDERGADSEA